MANLREIQSRINSIKDTRKITNAMYMISSTKLRKAKQRLDDTEPYFYALQSMIDRMSRHLPASLKHRYIEVPDQERSKIGLLVISGDKGLAGAYNHNVLKLAESFLQNTTKEVKVYMVGELGRQYFSSKHIPIAEDFFYTAQNPTFNRARWIGSSIIQDYLDGTIDEVHVIYTRMENSMVSEAEDRMILPLKFQRNIDIPMDVYHEEFFMLPTPEAALETIVPNYVTGFIYCALVESFYSENNARMMAMQSATDNADSLLKDLSIMYNRARQAAITQEITEVCAGAKAQQRK